MTSSRALWLALAAFVVGLCSGVLLSSRTSLTVKPAPSVTLTRAQESKPSPAAAPKADSGYESKPAPTSQPTPVLDDASLWHAFVEGDQAKKTKHDDLLREAALHRLRTCPDIARRAWGALLAKHEILESRPPESLEDEVRSISRLLLFQDALEQAITSSESTFDLRDALSILEQVTAKIAENRNRIAKTLLKDIPLPNEKELAKEDEKSLKILFSFAVKPEVRNAFDALIGTMPERGGDPVLKDVLFLEQSISSLSRRILERTQVDVKKYQDELEKPEPVEPAETKANAPQFGRGEKLLDELANLKSNLEQVNLDAWRRSRQIADPSKVLSSQSAAPEEFIVQVQSDAQRTQFMAYNLWALREIHAAETGDSWPERLARIDPGVLSPAVATLYSSVQSRRIEDERDPRRRGRAVRLLMAPTKTPLAAF